MHPDQLDGELMLAPGFAIPPNMDYQGRQSLFAGFSTFVLEINLGQGNFLGIFSSMYNLPPIFFQATITT